MLGKCPYCKTGKIEIKDKIVNGKKVKLYACSNANWKKEFDLWVLTEESTCDFKIWQDKLGRYGKWLKYNDIKTLLKEGELEVELISKKYKEKKKYKKTIILNKEYGVEVIWG